MKRWSTGFLASLAACVSAVASAQDGPKSEVYAERSAEDWHAAAQTDVLAAYRIFVESHPGIYDLENPGFPGQLADARAAGLDVAASAQTEAEYRRALAAFSAVLSDGHALAYAQPRAGLEGADGLLWPGHVAVWRGEQLLVRSPDTDDPLHGAEITGCDGVSIRDFLKSALLTRYFRPEEGGQWWVRPSQLFFSKVSMQEDAPDQCTYRLENGETISRTLDWSEPTLAERDFFNVSVFGSQEPVSLAEPRPGIFLIGLQTFQPDASEIEAYGALYEDVRARRDELKAARAVVLDLRRNNGGSSSWSKDLADLLWGMEARASREPRGASTWWRTSVDNAKHVLAASEKIRAGGRPALADAWVRFSAEMDAARARGEPLWKQDGMLEEDAPPVPVLTDFQTPVYVITPGSCASACLDAIDYFTLFDNTRLIGAPTSADSTYMDVRVENLPAGPGVLVVPNKVYQGRSRGWGDFYEPDIVMTALDWSTERFLDRIEQDLTTD